MGNKELFNTVSDCFVDVVNIMFYIADVDDVDAVVECCFPKAVSKWELWTRVFPLFKLTVYIYIYIY